LSSSSIGSVSTRPATIAAAIGAHSVNRPGGIGVTAGATNRLSATAPAEPTTMNAINPLHVFRGFHGSGGPPIAVPARVADPSPNAITPQAAATISRR
jgi:hypothetical protein